MSSRFKRLLSILLTELLINLNVYSQKIDNSKENRPDRSSTTNDSYEVYTAVIHRFYENSNAPIVIDEILEPCPDSSYFQQDTSKLIDPLNLAKMNNDCVLGAMQTVDLKRFGGKTRFYPNQGR